MYNLHHLKLIIKKSVYSDFEFLRERLLKTYPNNAVAVLPVKSMFANLSGANSEVIKERVRCFKHFLSLLTSHLSFSKSDEIRRFLTKQKESLKFEDYRANLTQQQNEEEKMKHASQGTGSGILTKFQDSFKSATSFASTVATKSKELVKTISGTYSDEIEGSEKLDCIEKVLQTLRNTVEELK